ncbi:hypothetical protein CCHR01_18896 [Colletotrichum chrysophilum]|uniref:Reverse transcriptase n=1 Tax=Colletotrichum chrysophilum TaxID=1836956 RepID=A0AAD9E5M3_9PEZI|nr:hypothetical protein CCHR01_18896 [Colletotrichum chrysophilum]
MARRNRQGIQDIIDRAVEWERRSGATFEADKAAIIHFTRNSDSTSLVIKGDTVRPKDHVKALGVTKDTKLRFEKHIADATKKGLEAVLGLRRLKWARRLLRRRQAYNQREKDTTESQQRSG